MDVIGGMVLMGLTIVILYHGGRCLWLLLYNENGCGSDGGCDGSVSYGGDSWGGASGNDGDNGNEGDCDG